MSNAVFPDLPGLSITLNRQPEWRTNIKEALSGVETLIAQRPWPRWRYTLNYDVLRAAQGEIATLAAFFCAHYGSYEDFLFVDPDFNRVDGQVFSSGDGTTTLFQLCRPVATWLEPVWAPGRVTITKNGVEQVAGADYTLGTRGQVQMTVPPPAGAVLSWTGNYYMRCRFSDDTLDLERMLWGFWKTGKVELISKVYPT